MYKNFDPRALGVAGRQSEIIELALTLGFRGLEIDAADFSKRVEMRGLEYSRRFLDSARTREHAKLEVGCFKLPLRWQGEEAAFLEDLAKLPQIIEHAATTGVTKCTTLVPPANDILPYHEYFEQSSKRLQQAAAILNQYDMRLGLTFTALKEDRADAQFEFIFEAEKLLVLVQTIGVENIGLTLDVWQWHLGGGTVDMIRNLPAEKIVTVRVAEVPEDQGSEELTEADHTLPRVGGPCNIEAYISALAAMGYQGPVTPYKSPKHMFGETREKIVLAATQALDALWEAAGLTKPPRSEYLRLLEDSASYNRASDDDNEEEDDDSNDNDSDDDDNDGDDDSPSSESSPKEEATVGA
jgi:sugar phosphate isomerase/epimerase